MKISKSFKGLFPGHHRFRSAKLSTPPPPPQKKNTKTKILPSYGTVTACLEQELGLAVPNQARTQGGALYSPSHLGKSSAQKCPKEERKFRPDMSAKKNGHVPLRYDKIKTKKVGEKEDISKRKG